MSFNSTSNYKVLKYIRDQLAGEELTFWLEGGTALSAYRDGIIFEWEHDIDLALWYNDLPRLLSAINQFIKDGCKVRVQKGFPFIDNIIQLYLPEKITGPKPQINQVDFYIYQSKENYAYMRWFNSPSGKYNEQLKNYYFKFKRLLLSPGHTTGKLKYINTIIPKRLRYVMFRTFFYYYYKLGKCIYHVQPIELFQNLKTVQFYDIPFQIPSETERYLVHRYGPSWKTPDSNFNTDFYEEKWKTVNARQELKFSLLEKPQIDFELQKLYINHLPDHMNGYP